MPNAPDPYDTQVIIHLYRGELRRSDVWRTRLDTTTNWALATATAVASFAFSSRDAPADILLLGIALATSFLFIEARRYRYYDLWIRRVRLLEQGFLAPLLRHEPPDPDAARELADRLSHPILGLSRATALAIRFHRNYAVIVAVLSAAFLVKLHSHPTNAHNAGEAIARARLGPLPGWLILCLLGVYLLFGAGLLLLDRLHPRPPGELASLPRSPRRMADLFRRR